MGRILTRVVMMVIALAGYIWAIQSETLAADGKDKIGPEQRPSTERNWQIGFTPSYSSGNFGTSTTSEFVYAPLSIRRLFRDGDVTEETANRERSIDKFTGR